MYEVIEYPEFVKQVDKIFAKQERHELIDFIAHNPTKGDIIKGTGGFRKIRYRANNKGKSGGVRVIYFFHTDIIRLFTIYAKSTTDNLTKEQANQLYSIAQILKK